MAPAWAGPGLLGHAIYENVPGARKFFGITTTTFVFKPNEKFKNSHGI